MRWDDLRWALELLRNEHIRPTIDAALPLSEAAEAHRRITSNETTGKLVLLPWAA